MPTSPVASGVNQTDGSHCASVVAPAKAGALGGKRGFGALGSRFRGNDARRDRPRTFKFVPLGCEIAAERRVEITGDDAPRRARDRTATDWEHTIHVGRDFAAHMDYTNFDHRGGGMRRAVRPYTWYTLLAAKISDDNDSGYTCWKPEIA